jgi:hypothetical protein
LLSATRYQRLSPTPGLATAVVAGSLGHSARGKLPAEATEQSVVVCPTSIMSHSTNCTSPPSIRIYDSGISRHGPYPIPLSHSRRTPSHTSTPAVPMPIPHAREAPPPPLPPPRYISGLDTGNDHPDLNAHHPHTPWQSRSFRKDDASSPAVGSTRSGFSLLGAMRAQKDTLADLDSFDARTNRRKSSTTTIHTVDTDMIDAFDVSDDERVTSSRRPSIVSRRYDNFASLLSHYVVVYRSSRVELCRRADAA